MQQEPHKEALGVQRGSEQPRDTPTKPSEQRHLDPIDVFCPGACEAEKPLRRRVAKAAGAATRRAQRSRHGRARVILWEAAGLASDWTFRPATIEELNDIIAALTWAFLCANTIERLEAPDER